MENQPVQPSDTQIPTPKAQPNTSETSPVAQKSKKWLIITLVLFLIVASIAAGYFIYKNYQLREKASQKNALDISPTEILPPVIEKENSSVLFSMYPGATFSASSSAFIKNIYDKISQAGDDQSPAKPVLVDAKYQSACEASGGKWYEKKGKDLPMARCICEYNDWREENLENVVERGCDCDLDCKGTSKQFSDFDFLGITENPRPSIEPSSPNNKYLIFKDEFSQCSFLGNINNSCATCINDEDCGKSSSGGSSRWLRHRIKAVCVKGECRHRRVIYTEL